MNISRTRPMEILRAIKEATAKHDPSYRLKKRGLLNAHDMKRLIPSREKLIYGYEDKGNGFVHVNGEAVKVEIPSKSPWLLTEEELKYAGIDIAKGIANVTETIKALKG